MKNKELLQIITIDGVDIPFVIENEDKYFPVKYVFEKFLLKSYINLYNKEEYKPYIKKCVIDWTFKGTVPQESNCMNIEGWKLYLDTANKNKNKDDKKSYRFNLWCDYVGSNNKIIKKVIEFDEYEQDCINYILRISPNIIFRECQSCNRKLPLNIGFFHVDKRSGNGYNYTCTKCLGGIYKKKYDHYEDKKSYDIYKCFGIDGYKLYKTDNIIDFYKKYVHKCDCFTLDVNIINNSKEFIYKLLQYYYNEDILNSNGLLCNYIKKLNIKTKYTNKLSINSYIEYISNNECKIRPYNYKNYKNYNITIDDAFTIFDNYLKDNNIVIEDIFNFNYFDIMKKCKLSNYYSNQLDFIVKYYNNKYSGYKFKIASANYYKDINNRIFDMKYLIEKDLKLDINKIPLYITKTFLSENYSPLYHVLNKTYYNGNLFKWINECYPNKFEEQDFNITKYRIEFDSFEEAQVDRILREHLDNVLYNLRNSKSEFTLMGMKPDWTILTEKGTILCEYFGMYLKQGGTEYRERLETYKNKTEIKFKKYDELEKVGYKHLYIFPEDLKNNYKGLIDKIKDINN